MNFLNCFCKLVLCTSLLMPGIHVTAYGQHKSENLFYMVNTENSFQSFKNNIKQISIAAPQSFSMTKEGLIYGKVDSRIMKLAKENNVKVMPLVVNPGFDQKLMQSFLKDEEAQQRAIYMMVQLAKKYDFYGWRFDFEGMIFTDRQAFTAYYRKTAEALHKAGLKLSVAAIAYDSDYEFPSPYFEFWYRTIEFKLPFSVLKKYGSVINPKAREIWKANFYQSASKGSNPHYLTWSYVQNDDSKKICNLKIIRGDYRSSGFEFYNKSR